MLAVLPLGQQIVCLLLGLCPCFVGVGAVVILAFGLDEDVAHVHHLHIGFFNAVSGVGIGVVVIVFADIVLGVGLLVDEHLQIGRGRDLPLDKGVVRRQRGCRAIGHLEIFVRAAVAVACGGYGDLAVKLVEVVLILLAQLEACKPGLLPDGGDVFIVRDSRLQEILLPGARVVKHTHLLVKRRAGVDKI